MHGLHVRQRDGKGSGSHRRVMVVGQDCQMQVFG